jgi:hypothetical protein
LIDSTTEELIRSVVLLENPLNNTIKVPDPNYAKHLPGPCPTMAHRTAATALGSQISEAIGFEGRETSRISRQDKNRIWVTQGWD